MVSLLMSVLALAVSAVAVSVGDPAPMAVSDVYSDFLTQLIAVQLIVGVIPLTAVSIGAPLVAGTAGPIVLSTLGLQRLLWPLVLVAVSLAMDLTLLAIPVPGSFVVAAGVIALGGVLASLIESTRFLNHVGSRKRVLGVVERLDLSWLQFACESAVRYVKVLSPDQDLDDPRERRFAAVTASLVDLLAHSDQHAFEHAVSRLDDRIKRLSVDAAVRRTTFTVSDLEPGGARLAAYSEFDSGASFLGLTPRAEALLDLYLGQRWTAMLQSAGNLRADWALRVILESRNSWPAALVNPRAGEPRPEPSLPDRTLLPVGRRRVPSYVGELVRRWKERGYRRMLTRLRAEQANDGFPPTLLNTYSDVRPLIPTEPPTGVVLFLEALTVAVDARLLRAVVSALDCLSRTVHAAALHRLKLHAASEIATAIADVARILELHLATTRDSPIIRQAIFDECVRTSITLYQCAPRPLEVVSELNRVIKEALDGDESNQLQLRLPVSPAGVADTEAWNQLAGDSRDADFRRRLVADQLRAWAAAPRTDLAMKGNLRQLAAMRISI